MYLALGPPALIIAVLSFTRNTLISVGGGRRRRFLRQLGLVVRAPDSHGWRSPRRGSLR